MCSTYIRVLINAQTNKDDLDAMDAKNDGIEK